MKFLNLRKNFNKIFFILAVFSFIGFASASIPQLIAFQGKLTDKNGALINGNTLITFNIYTTQTGGSSIYTESDNINVSNGLVSWLIGSNTPLTLPFDQQYYLGVTVDGDIEMTPRLALSDAPYAFNSINANNSAFLGGVAASGYMLTNGGQNLVTTGNITTANAFIGGVKIGTSSYYNGNGNINASNSVWIGGILNDSGGAYFGGGLVVGSSITASGGIDTAGTLTASSASIGGHTPWTNGTCIWNESSFVAAHGYVSGTEVFCPPNTIPISGEVGNSIAPVLYIQASYHFWNGVNGGWAFNINNPNSVDYTIPVGVLCCPIS